MPHEPKSKETKLDISSVFKSASKGITDIGLIFSPSTIANADVIANAWNALETDSKGVLKIAELQDQISDLRKQIHAQTEQLTQGKKNQAEHEQKIRLILKSREELNQKLELSFLLDRVSTLAGEKLISDSDFKKKFFDQKNCNAYVVSVDIRRSTELMLKARKPELFADFISTLCQQLEVIIKNNFGVFDKFTGDGVLSFFPEFYSGKDAGYLALLAPQLCQEKFNELYKQFRGSFSTVLRDVGLGIGIDYGPVHLLRVAGGLTVVGSPVVYACRLSGAPPGQIFLNQPASEEILSKYGGLCYSDEVDLEIKHEGTVLAYNVKLTRKDFKPVEPEWLTLQVADDAVEGKESKTSS
jgi:hypothetical protein